MQRVAGDNAARPAVPASRPTNALSILDKRGELRKIPSAGMANVNIFRLDAFGVSIFVSFDVDVISTESLFESKRELFFPCSEVLKLKFW